MDVRGNVIQVPRDLAPIGIRGIPVGDLQSDEHPEDDDHEVDGDGGPALLADVLDDAAENHGRRPASGARTWVASRCCALMYWRMRGVASEGRLRGDAFTCGPFGTPGRGYRTCRELSSCSRGNERKTTCSA